MQSCNLYIFYGKCYSSKYYLKKIKHYLQNKNLIKTRYKNQCNYFKKKHTSNFSKPPNFSHNLSELVNKDLLKELKIIIYALSCL